MSILFEVSLRDQMLCSMKFYSIKGWVSILPEVSYWGISPMRFYSMKLMRSYPVSSVCKILVFSLTIFSSMKL